SSPRCPASPTASSSSASCAPRTGRAATEPSDDPGGCMSEPLTAEHVLEFPGGYTRTTGPVIGRFLTELRAGRIVGVRTAEGRVLVPPLEYDPATGDPVTDEYVEVGPAGTVTTSAWVTRPRPEHPLDRPFAWALIKLDGAAT